MNEEGHDAIAEKAPSVKLNKHEDPVEGAREGISISEAVEIAKWDPSLIYATR